MSLNRRIYTQAGGNMRYYLALLMGKISIIALKLLKKRGTTTPGTIALKICPDILKILSSKISKNIVAVLGTNGKTTTNNLLADTLELSGMRVACNRIGANMMSGAATAMLEKTTFFGRMTAAVATLEMDEAWARHIFKEVSPNVVIINNLFRDQLDRYGEIESTMQYLKDAISLVPDAVIIANGDDPLVYSVVSEFKNKKKFFGIKDEFTHSGSVAKEGKFCYRCGKPLKYEFYHFSQLGAYSCECGFSRPALDFYAENIKVFPKVEFDVNNFGHLSLNGRGTYNIYNILASAAGAIECGADFSATRKCAENYTPQVGRMEEFVINGKPVCLILAKNPTGFNLSVDAVLEDTRKKDLVIGINDYPQDGRDVSWLWDVNFDALVNDNNILSCQTTGLRYADMALRLKYSGMKETDISLFADYKAAVDNALEKDGEVLYILANYTSLFEIQAYVKEKAK